MRGSTQVVRRVGPRSWFEHRSSEYAPVSEGVERVVGDHCRYGAEVIGWPVSLLPKVLNSPRRRCTGKLGRFSRHPGGEHATCSAKIAKDDQRYPLGLRNWVLRGTHQEFQDHGIMKVGEVGMHALEGGDQTQLDRGPGQGDSGRCLDDISKQTLRDDLAQEAQRKESQHFVSKRSASDRRHPPRRGSHISACDR